MKFYPIIPAGGFGKRLWPLSTASNPKFLLDVLGDGSNLLENTIDRVSPTSSEIFVVVGADHADKVEAVLDSRARGPVCEGEPMREDPPQPCVCEPSSSSRETEQSNKANVALCVEPEPKGSLPAIAFAVSLIFKLHGDSIFGTFPADHVIKSDSEFRRFLEHAVGIAEKSDKMVILGINPTEPSTAYGYIEYGEKYCSAAPNAGTANTANTANTATGGITHFVKSFKEKPDKNTAAKYIKTGLYRWNAGMFVCKCSVFLDMLSRFESELSSIINAIVDEYIQVGRINSTLWGELTKHPIETAIIEKLPLANDVLVVDGEFEWSDVGDFLTLERDTEIFKTTSLPASGAKPSTESTATHKDSQANTSRSKIVEINSSGNAVISSKKKIALIGINDVFVAETDNSLLIVSKDCVQDVKKAAEQLE
jgi:mannose-1-phosphate guanylyltransferase